MLQSSRYRYFRGREVTVSRVTSGTGARSPQNNFTLGNLSEVNDRLGGSGTAVAGQADGIRGGWVDRIGGGTLALQSHASLQSHAQPGVDPRMGTRGDN